MILRVTLMWAKRVEEVHVEIRRANCRLELLPPAKMEAIGALAPKPWTRDAVRALAAGRK
jgi:hypothetical protein